MTSKRRAKTKLAGVSRLAAPPSLRSAEIDLDGEPYLLLSYELPRWELPPGLTPAEREIVLAVLQGASRAEIAQLRGTSARTVSNILANAFRKLGVQSRIELAAQLSANAR
jgi:DNA-binding CsgD family transcriptional regulator